MSSECQVILLLTPASNYDKISNWLGISLLTSTGSQWKAKRRMLTSAFHFKILQNYAQVNFEQTNIFLSLMYVHTESPLDLLIHASGPKLRARTNT